jgi:regulatory protein
MSKITRMVAGRGREKRVNVYLDGEFALSLAAEVALKEGLSIGREITGDDLRALADADGYQRCLNAALRFLAYRPRSEAEVRQRLQKRGFEDGHIARVLARLKEQGLVDDAAFARYWLDNRESFSPRSRRLTGMELARKGLARDIIEDVLAGLDEGASAYRAALSKARHLSPADYEDFRRRLVAYLGRRGFGYDIVRETVARVWKECGTAART